MVANQTKWKEAWQPDPNHPWVESRAEFEELVDNIVEVADQAVKNGIKVHFADYTWEQTFDGTIAPPPDELKTMNQAWETEWKSYHQANPDLYEGLSEQELKEAENKFYAEKIETLPEAEKQHLKKLAEQHIQDIRTARLDDTDQYNYLRQKIPHGERILGIVGGGHLNNISGKPNGIDDLLDGKVITIETYKDLETWKTMQQHTKDEGRTPTDKPEYVITLDDGKIYDAEGYEIGNLNNIPPIPDRDAVNNHNAQAETDIGAGPAAPKPFA